MQALTSEATGHEPVLTLADLLYDPEAASDTDLSLDWLTQLSHRSSGCLSVQSDEARASEQQRAVRNWRRRGLAASRSARRRT